MTVSRASLRSFVEWVAAAALMFAVLALGSLALREVRTVSAVPPVSATEGPLPVASATVPSGAASVPVLLLTGGKEIRVGVSESEVAGQLRGEASIETESIERGPNGERLTRSYEYAGTRFILVLEPFAQGDQRRVAAIYLR